MVFSLSLGPRREADDPIITWQCPGYTIPSRLMAASTWWFHDLAAGLVSPDGKRMKGSYAAPAGAGRASWEWDLHLEP